MTKSKTTRRALLSSCVALMLCFSMLLGTTYAWFTDSVTSQNNIIKSGTLDATLEYKNEAGNFVDASTGKIFDYQYWEPGYVDVKTVKIGNIGNLAFKYQLNIIPNVKDDDAMKLAEVIDVYMFDDVASRADVNSATPVGTLKDLMNDTDGAAYGYLLPTSGSSNVDTTGLDQNLIKTGEIQVSIALKMQETANNDYQNLSVGDGFSVQLLATQLTYENDSFDNSYDSGLTPGEDGDILVEEDGIQYIYQKNGGVTLYLVTENYTGDTVNVKEGTTAIGNYAFAHNSNVKTVVMADSVRDLGRGFDSSTVEKVVLNEGLETISSRAFRETTALKEVVISSTVKTIADNAFQKSGIKNITIPATVETIGETAFGASKIETVTFEGNTSIQGYAFRGCPNLRTVYLNGNDVTFIASTLNGRNSPWFCNGESNNPNTSDITFYVVNDTVAARVKTAMGAEADNTTVIVLSSADTADELVEALENGKSVVLTSDIEMEAATTAPYGNKYAIAQKGGVLDGNGKTLTVDCYGDDYGIMTSGGTIKNLTVEGVARGVVLMKPTEDVILDNVILKNKLLYPMNTAEHATVKGVDLIVTDSTFGGWTSFAGIESASFTSSDFVNGNYGYGWPYYCLVRPYVNTNFVDCAFTEGYYLDLSALGEDCTVTLESCTVNGIAITADICDTKCDSTETFCVELPSGRDLADCVIFK